MGSADAGRYGLWLLRGLWVALPAVAWLTLADTFAGLDRPLVAEVPLWALWFGGLVATLVPSPVGLTALRLAAPAVVVWPLVILVLDGGGASLVAAAAYGALVCAVLFAAVVGDVMINGSAYGSERRMALRAPGFALLGPIPLVWTALFAATAGLWLAALDGRWALAAGLAVVSLAVGFGAWRVLYQLARRWLVFVPAGFVIHDHLMAAESILLRRTIVSRLGPATDESLADAADLSGRAPGLALDVALKEPVPFGRRVRGEVHSQEADRLVFTPTLPGAVLREARVRAIKVGAAPQEVGG